MNGWNKPKGLLSSEELKIVAAYNEANDVAYISEASVGELLYGIERSQKKEYNRRNFEKLLLAIPPCPCRQGCVGNLRTNQSRLKQERENYP